MTQPSNVAKAIVRNTVVLYRGIVPWYLALNGLFISRFFGPDFCCREYRSNFNYRGIIDHRLTEFNKITQNNVNILNTQFKVIQGHQFRYQWKVRMQLPYVLTCE